jgi:hypothetical protein
MQQWINWSAISRMRYHHVSHPLLIRCEYLSISPSVYNILKLDGMGVRFLKEQSKKSGGRLRIPEYLKLVDDLTALPSPSSRSRQGGLAVILGESPMPSPRR